MSSKQSGDYAKAVKTFSKIIPCRSRTCTSFISVTPSLVDFGECNVGDYRRFSFTVNNESDLPALVLPCVDSESMNIIEKELLIPARQSKVCNIEYVARAVQSSYKKVIMLINVFNSHCNLSVDVKAKNVDTHHVLQHSLFYDLYSRTSKKQLQLYFEECVYNTPNVRLFSIRNIYQELINIEITRNESSDVKIYVIRNHAFIYNASYANTLSPYSKGIGSKKFSIDALVPDLNTNVSEAAMKLLFNSPDGKQFKYPKRSASFGGNEVVPKKEGVDETTDSNQPLKLERSFTNEIDIEKIGSDAVLVLDPSDNSLLNPSSSSTHALSSAYSNDNQHVANKESFEVNADIVATKSVTQIHSNSVLNKDFLNTMDSASFPFSLFNTSEGDLMKSTSDNEAFNTLQKCYRQLNEVSFCSSYSLFPHFIVLQVIAKEDLVVPISKLTIPNLISIPVGHTCDFIVVYEPKSNQSDLDSRYKYNSSNYQYFFTNF